MIPRIFEMRRLALLLAPLIGAAVAIAIPVSFVDADGATQPLLFSARVVAALVIWMALWWMLEPIPIYATALLPLVVLPIVGVAPLAEIVSHYTSTLLVLFLGGFILALALQRWGLHKRIVASHWRDPSPNPWCLDGSCSLFEFVDVEHFHNLDDGADCRKYCQSAQRAWR